MSTHLLLKKTCIRSHQWSHINWPISNRPAKSLDIEQHNMLNEGVTSLCMRMMWSITYCIQWFEMWKANRCRHHRQQTQGDDKYIAQTFDAGELKKKQCFFKIIFFSIFMKIRIMHSDNIVLVSTLSWQKNVRM